MSSDAAALRNALANNKESRTPVGSSVEACPLAQCEVSSLTVTCAHPERNMRLDLLGGKPTRNGKDYVLQVVSNPDKVDEITVIFAGSCGCGNPAEVCPTVSVQGGLPRLKQPPGQVKFPAHPPAPKQDGVGFLAFLKHYLIPKDLIPQRYVIQNMKCSGTGAHQATVEAFPYCGWKGEVAFGYEQPKSFNKAVNQGKGYTQLTDQGKWVLKGACTLNIGGKIWNLGREGKERQDHYFPGLKKTVGKIVPFLSDLAGDISSSSSEQTNTLTIQWPNIALSGDVKLVEVAGKYNVDVEGEIALAMDPLIGATFNTDILEWIIRVAAPGYSAFLLRIKRAAAEGKESKHAEGKAMIGLLLDISGNVAGELKWTKKPGNAWVALSGAKSGEVSAALGFTLKAKMVAEGRVFFVEVKMGAELSLMAAQLEYDAVSIEQETIGIIGKLTATTEAGAPALGGQIIFTGAAIYYTYYLEVGVKATESEDEKKKGRTSREGGDDKFEKTTDISKKEEKLEKLVTLFEPHTWPGETATPSKAPKPMGLSQAPL